MTKLVLSLLDSTVSRIEGRLLITGQQQTMKRAESSVVMSDVEVNGLRDCLSLFFIVCF